VMRRVCRLWRDGGTVISLGSAVPGDRRSGLQRCPRRERKRP
jgi:hypothetical protein